MSDRHYMELGRPARRVRLATLVGLRWLAIGGQSAAVLTVRFVLGFPLPLAACLFVIASAAFVNIVLRFRYPQMHRLDDDPTAILLGFDIIQLSALLYLTGGLTNPFAMLFLAPLMISAASLSPRRTLLLGLVIALAATILMMHHLPLPWFQGQHLDLPAIFSFGTWLAIVLGSAFTGAFASRVAEEARQLADALTATELVLAREQHLTQLDGLAAAAAHELGTPLATITIVVKEMQRAFGGQGASVSPTAFREDVDLLDQEVNRCRTILRRLASLGNETSGPMDRMTLSHIMEEVVGPQRHFGISMTVTKHSLGEEPVCLRNPGILYGLGNLVENAIDYAKSTVEIDTSWTAEEVTVSIVDDGPGFPPDVLARLGEPYVTSRHAERKAKVEGSGLGLGMFIAKTLLERSGAKLVTGNRSSEKRGAAVTVIWPRSIFEHDAAPVISPAQSRRQALQSLQNL